MFRLLCVYKHKWRSHSVFVDVMWCWYVSITWQVVWSLELVGDVAALKNLKDQVLTLRLDLLFQSDLYLSHDLGFT